MYGGQERQYASEKNLSNYNVVTWEDIDLTEYLTDDY